MDLLKDKLVELLNISNIVDVVSNYVDLKKIKKPPNTYRGLCPFHESTKYLNTKTPYYGFMVNGDKKIFHCFVCGEGGDIIKFLMKKCEISYFEAIRELANQYGIDFFEKLHKSNLGGEKC